jgi:multiple sugar transport system ATP-binding protein
MAGVTFDRVAKRYGPVSVIEGLDLDIRDHEFMVLVGPSGCGKSTALRMIAGLEEISDGRVLIGDRVVNDLEPKDRDVAMVFQNYALYPHMTVRQNIEFGLKIRKTPRAEMKRKVDEAAQTLGIDALLDRRPKQLSGGQRQRVAVARAIVRDPKVFLFDEPLSNLDAKLRVAMRAEIKELHQRLKITTVYVTHDQTEAMTMADRIVVMRDGIVEQIGTPLEIYDRPATTFVAGFIGMPAMNLLKGRIQADAPSIFRTESGVAMPLSLRPGTADPGEELIYGIRPEQFVIADDGTPAKVVVVEPTGAETQVVARIEGARIGEENVNMLFRERIAVRPGDAIRFALRSASEHLFSAATGRRLPDADA